MLQNVGLFWSTFHETSAGILQMSIRSCRLIVYLNFLCRY